MKRIQNIFHDKDHRWTLVTRDPDKPSYMIDTNECLVVSGDEALLTDPGGLEIFPSVFSALSTGFNPKQIKAIFASHQDPDIISSLSLWLEVNPELKCYISRLWTTFVPHFGGNEETFTPIPDEGMTILLGSLKLQCIPAHYLHSSGNFHLYDQRARVYFSGDVGAALLDYSTDIYVKNFDEHIKSAIGFHQRWMGSNEARLNWCERVSELEIDMLVPQHGSVYQGKDVKRFIDWFSALKVGLFTMGTELNEPVTTEEVPKIVEEIKEPEPVIQTRFELPEIPEQAGMDGHIIVSDDSDLKALMGQDTAGNKIVDNKSQKFSDNSFFTAIKNFFKFNKK